MEWASISPPRISNMIICVLYLAPKYPEQRALLHKHMAADGRALRDKCRAHYFINIYDTQFCHDWLIPDEKNTIKRLKVT